MAKYDIPITKPWLPEETMAQLAGPVESGWLVQGPKTTELEEEIAALAGCAHGVAVSSGTTALFAALAALGVGPGDEVVASPYSFPATANVIVHLGAIPVFVDIDLKTYNLDPELIEPALTDRTKAIMPVHQVGLPADMDPINDIARSRNLVVVEDAACALGSTYKGRPVGSGADSQIKSAACFSFHPRKVLTTGEGGMIVTDDAGLADRLRRLVSHGLEGDKGYTDFGYNFRLSDLHSAVGLAQIPYFGEHLARRRKLAAAYDADLAGDERIITPFVPDYAGPNYQSYLVRLPGLTEGQRDKVLRRLHALGIYAKGSIEAIPYQPVYLDRFGRPDLPNCLAARDAVVCLPLYPTMAETDRAAVARELIKAIDAVNDQFDPKK